MKNQAQRCREIAMAVGWRHPVILTTLPYITFEESTAARTFLVYLSGRVEVNPHYSAATSDKKLAGVICHEILHLVLYHHYRGEGAIQKTWNQAVDMSINGMIREMGLELPDGALLPPHQHRSSSAEEIYGWLLEQQGGGSSGGSDDGEDDSDGDGDLAQAGGEPEGGDGEQPPKLGQGCSVIDDSGKTGKTREELDRQWGEAAFQAQSLGAGTVAGNALARLLTVKPPKVRWEALLRNASSQALAAHGRDDQSFSRRNRRNPPGIILPGWTAQRARVAVIIDSSGSVSDEELERAVASVGKLGKLSGLRVYLVVHDHTVQWKGWVDGEKTELVKSKITGRGGTCFDGAYAALVEARAKFDVMVHMTDGEVGYWPPKPRNVRRMFVGLTRGTTLYSAAPEGTRIVPIEV